MKATITQRFHDPATSATYDVDCDCRFLFFCLREDSGGADNTIAWKVRFVKLVYEKDRVVPVDGRRAPVFDDAELARYPEGYRYLGAAQARLGYPVEARLPTPRDADMWGRMYGAMEAWLAGEEVSLLWDGEGHGKVVADGVGNCIAEPVDLNSMSK